MVMSEKLIRLDFVDEKRKKNQFLLYKIKLGWIADGSSVIDTNYMLKVVRI